MDEYKLLYIDEDPKENHRFKRAFAEDFTVSTIDFTDITLESLALRLEERDFDYLIVDFHLNEKSVCGFDGDEILTGFLAKFPEFPAMLLTNHGEAAVENAKNLDVERIRSKKEYSTDDLKEVFVRRIKAKVDEYRKNNTEAEEKIAILIAKKASGEELTAEEEAEAIRLDTFLDKSLDGQAREIPEEMKLMSNTVRLESLLDKTDKLIDKLEEYETVPE